MAATEARAGFPMVERNGDHGIPASPSARIGAVVVAIAPLTLFVGLIYHPYLSRPTDEASIAAAASSDPTRWALAHLVVGVGYGLTVLAFLAVRRYLRAAGEDRWSLRAMPPVALGSVLFAMLTGMEITLAAAADRGAAVQEIQASLFPLFAPVLMVGAVSFGAGMFGFARGIARSGVLSPGPTRMVVAALMVIAIARVVPLSAASYVLAAAGLVALWPLANAMWRQGDGESRR